MSTLTVKVKGVSIDFPGGARVVPPLSLAAVEALGERLANFTGGTNDVGTVIDALHLALRRNYPDITREDVAELVDLGNMMEVMDAVMNVSRLNQRTDAPSGEAQAAR